MFFIFLDFSTSWTCS